MSRVAGGDTPRYRLERLLGRGASSEVWKATDGRQSYALKMLSGAEALDPASQEEFLAEGELLRKLNVPGVVQLHDCGVWRGRPMLVLELIDGSSLEQLLEAPHPLPPEVALWWTADLARTLGAVHAARDGSGRPLQVVHRDLHPGNILAERSGRLRVSDFGIARAPPRLERPWWLGPDWTCPVYLRRWQRW